MSRGAQQTPSAGTTPPQEKEDSRKRGREHLSQQRPASTSQHTSPQDNSPPKKRIRQGAAPQHHNTPHQDSTPHESYFLDLSETDREDSAWFASLLKRFQSAIPKMDHSHLQAELEALQHILRTHPDLFAQQTTLPAVFLSPGGGEPETTQHTCSPDQHVLHTSSTPNNTLGATLSPPTPLHQWIIQDMTASAAHLLLLPYREPSQDHHSDCTTLPWKEYLSQFHESYPQHSERDTSLDNLQWSQFTLAHEYVALDAYWQVATHQRIQSFFKNLTLKRHTTDQQSSYFVRVSTHWIIVFDSNDIPQMCCILFLDSEEYRLKNASFSLLSEDDDSEHSQDSAATERAAELPSPTTPLHGDDHLAE